MGQKITPEDMLRMYAIGMYPMADSRESKLYYEDPAQRMIIFPSGFHLPQRLRRKLRQNKFKVTCDIAFAAVVAGCADRKETWITKELNEVYIELFRKGYAHSLEVWQDTQLVGGLFGTAFKGMFVCDSLFYRVTDASKIALVHLMARLVKGRYRFLDLQIPTDHLAQFGGTVITKQEFKQLLQEARTHPAIFPVLLTESPLRFFL